MPYSLVDADTGVHALKCWAGTWRYIKQKHHASKDWKALGNEVV